MNEKPVMSPEGYIKARVFSLIGPLLLLFIFFGKMNGIAFVTPLLELNSVLVIILLVVASFLSYLMFFYYMAKDCCFFKGE